MRISIAVLTCTVAMVTSPSIAHAITEQSSARTSIAATATAGAERGTLGPGGWDGARTNHDGRELLIVFTGGPKYNASDPCSIKYRARVRETADEVRVQVLGSRPPQPITSCDLVGYRRDVRVSLSRPLGKRKLIDAQLNREKPVFNGATLVEPSWLPNGWRAGAEGPGYPNPETVRTWSRSWSPPPAPPQGDHCTPAPTAMTLTQGPPDRIARYPRAGEQPTATYDVRGSPATYSVGVINGDSVTATLRWTQRREGFVLATFATCVGDTPTPLSTMLRFARSLTIS